MGKLEDERVSAVKRVGEATSEEQLKKLSKRAQERCREREDEQVAYFWRPDFKRPLSNPLRL